MAEDQISDLVDARAPRTTHRPPQPVTIHPLPPQGTLADAQPRLSPKLGVNGNDEISALKLAVPIVRRWPVILASAAVIGALAVAATFIVPPRYTARTSFTVEAGSNSLSMPKGLVGIAGQLGVVLGGNATGGPPEEYFTALATSRTIKEAVLSSRYADGALTPAGGGRPLLELLNVEGDTPARRMENGVRQLGRMLRTDVARQAGVVTIAVADREPRRAAAIGNRLIEVLNTYNVEQRQSRSRHQRELAQRSLAEAQRELRAAEERLQDFLSRNRRYQQSPLLVFEANRLERAVLQKQEVATGLAQAYEEARISEAGDIPVISMIDAAVPPTRRSFPVRWQFLFAGLFLGGLMGLILAYLLEARRTWIAEQQPDFLALREAARLWKARLRGRHVRA
jgi:tyrosine-protein kinase Etk/Wzc